MARAFSPGSHPRSPPGVITPAVPWRLELEGPQWGACPWRAAGGHSAAVLSQQPQAAAALGRLCGVLPGAGQARHSRQVGGEEERAAGSPLQTSRARWTGPLGSTGGHILPAPSCLGAACTVGEQERLCRRSGGVPCAGGCRGSGGHRALAGAGRDSPGPFHLSQIFCLFFFFFPPFFNPLASLTLFYNPWLGSLKSTLVIKHVGACE